MKRQFDFTYAQLRKSVRQAKEAYDLACRQHRGQRKAHKDLVACMTALLKYETRHRSQKAAA